MTDAFNYVFRAYTDPARHYHDLFHIADLLKYAYLYGDPKKTLDDNGLLKRELYDAILFHDVVYRVIPGLVSNEEASARVYLEYALAFLPEDQVRPMDEATRVANMIRATEHHFDGSAYDDYLTNLLLDIDILSFTADYDTFVETNALIADEFIPTFGEEHVKRKRRAFLQNIYENDSLYYRVIDPDGSLRKAAYANIHRYLLMCTDGTPV